MLKLWKIGTLAIAVTAVAFAQTPANPSILNARLEQASLVTNGSLPFHLKTEISSKNDPAYHATIEMFWLSGNVWRREIKSAEFSQVIISNDSGYWEKNDGDYLPLQFATFAVAMVDPTPLLALLQSSDKTATKANGARNESGVTCFDKNLKFCMTNPYGLDESIAPPGHAVDFMNYKDFHGKRVARILTNAPRLGQDRITAQITKLEELKKPDMAMFAISQVTPTTERIQIAYTSEATLRKLAAPVPPIIWPQPLDGATSGVTSFYISTDRAGHVREVLPLSITNERTNDSAANQIKRWHFQSALIDGVPAQTEGVLTFSFNTRQYGPATPLTDAEVRKLVPDAIDPVLPSGKYPSGTLETLRAAIDADGNLIEVIPEGDAYDFFMPCYEAIKKWHFRPIMENGEPRPYRANIEFRAP